MSDPSSFDALGGNLALDFVNTVANRGSPEKRRELLATPADVRSWLAKFELPEGDFEDSDVAEARAIRERLHALFRSVAEDVSIDQAALDAFGVDLRAAGAERNLQRRNDRINWGWGPSARAVQRSLFPVLVAAAELLVSDDLGRVRECQGPGCGWLFLDRSRGRPRRWCSMRDCGNKAKAHRHYYRRRRDAPPTALQPPAPGGAGRPGRVYPDAGAAPAAARHRAARARSQQPIAATGR